MGTVIPEHLRHPSPNQAPSELSNEHISADKSDWADVSLPSSTPARTRPGSTTPSAYLPLADSVPDPRNWQELPQSNVKFSHSFTSIVEQLYHSDLRKQGPLFEPTTSTAVYFLVHTAPSMSDDLEVLVFSKEGDTIPTHVAPMKRLEDGRLFVGIDDGGVDIGEGTRFAYRNKTTGALIADPYAYEVSKFRWTKVPARHEMPTQEHFEPIHCVVRQDPLSSFVRDRNGQDIAPAPEHTQLRTVKFHTLRTSDLTDEQLGAGFEGTQGTLKALQSPFVQEQLLKRGSSIGFNQVELFPIQAQATEVPTFHENHHFNPQASNVWGYMQISHFAIEPSLVSDKGNPWREVIETVNSLHKAGIRVSFDMAPHTFEGGDHPQAHNKGPSINFRALDREGYYATYPDGQLRDYSGCGNAFRFVPPPGRKYEAGSLESQLGEGGAYFFRAIESVFRLGADVRIDQGIMLGRGRRGGFHPDAAPFQLLSQIANDYGCRVHCETGDCGRDGPGSSDWLKVEPYAALAPVYPESKIRTQDFIGGREIPRDAMSDSRRAMMQSVADVFGGRGSSYFRNGLTDSYRVVTVGVHDGYTLYDDLKERLAQSAFRWRHFWDAEQNLLDDSEKGLDSARKESLIEQRMVSAAALGVEFLTAFSPSTVRLWSFGTEVLVSQDGNHNAYDQPQFSSQSFAQPEAWRQRYLEHWIEKEQLREELGVFSHARFLGDPSLSFFDDSGLHMNRDEDKENERRWTARHSGQVLSAWYSGREFNRPDVLVTWCSGPRKFDSNGVQLPDPGSSETGERYVWLRRADSSALIVPDDKPWKSGVYEPIMVEAGKKVYFQTGGVQVFQRVTEREALHHLAEYRAKTGQA